MGRILAAALSSLILSTVNGIAVDTIGDALALFQMRAEKVSTVEGNKSRKEYLPEVSEVIRDSDDAAKEMTSKINAFESSLHKVYHHGSTEISKMKAKYQKELHAQRAENDLVKQANKQIKAEIESLRASNAERRETANNLTKSCKKLTEQLRSIHSNLTTAEEFADKSLNSSAEMLNDTQAMGVLFELDAKEASLREAEIRAASLKDISKGAKMSLLQTDGDLTTTETKPQDDAQALLRNLMSAIGEYTTQQNESETALKSAFDQEFAEGNETHTHLLEKQAELNETKAAEISLQEQLDVAVDFLTKKEAKLTEQTRALRRFAQKLGATVPPTSNLYSALLQLARGTLRGASLPHVHELTKQPDNVIDRLHSHLYDLGESLSEQQQEQLAAVKAQKHEYEKKIKQQEALNWITNRTNTELEAEIESVRQSNIEMRSRANNVSKEIEQLTAQMEGLQFNISSAQDFTRDLLDRSGAMLENATVLSVLDELDEKDAKEEQARNHQAQLSEIEGVSLLQVASEGVGDDAADLLKELQASLGVLSDQQNVSEAMLKSSFEKELTTARDQYAVLTDKQEQLNTTLTHEKHLHKKLRAAVKHLEATRDEMLERTTALRRYAHMVGLAEVNPASATDDVLIDESEPEADEMSAADEADESAPEEDEMQANAETKKHHNKHSRKHGAEHEAGTESQTSDLDADATEDQTSTHEGGKKNEIAARLKGLKDGLSRVWR